MCYRDDVSMTLMFLAASRQAASVVGKPAGHDPATVRPPAPASPAAEPATLGIQQLDRLARGGK